MRNKLHEALNEIQDRHISDAARAARRSPRILWLGTIAAVLAACILIGMLHTQKEPLPVLQHTQPISTTEKLPASVNLVNLVASKEYPKMAAFPNYTGNISNEAYSAAYDIWVASQKAQYNQPTGYADSLTNFFIRSIPEVLKEDGNQAFSPLNVYMALVMLAEITEGQSRQQILEFLGADSIENLRTQAGHIWNAHYSADGLTSTVLANSVWLDDAYTFRQETVDRLANSHYAAVFHGNLGTKELNQQLGSWLNQQTGGLLEKQAENAALHPDTVFALASTVHFHADWDTGFSGKNTKENLFHCASGDVSVAFMNSLRSSTYYWSENFGAVCLELSGNNCMWLILPDEGFCVSDILKTDAYLRLIMDPAKWENQKKCMIDLSLPKFDVSSQTDLAESLQTLGITDIFDCSISDFTPITESPGLFVNKIDHAVRVSIDEAGVAAAAYTVIATPSNPRPPTDEIAFILDRPFLFVISSQDQLPLFAGTVREP